MINDNYYRRRWVISGLVVAVVLVYIIRLFALQIIDKSTLRQAQKIAIIEQTVFPSRGLIFDRNGELLVFNQPIYEVTLVMREMGKDFDTLRLCQALQMDKESFDKRLLDIKDKKKNPAYSQWTPQVLISQLSKKDVAVLQEMQYEFKGVYVRKRTLRDYTYNSSGHILGSVGEVGPKDIERDPYYQAGDYSGRDGIERTYDKVLRGQKGVEYIMRDNKGRIQGPYKGGKDDKAAEAGQDLTLTIDIQLQMLAEKMLQGKIGSAVAIEPETGEILAMASNPAWNPQVLVGRERSKNYISLLHDKTKPLMNRATQATYPPGSTFKTVQALVCLQTEGIRLSTEYPCSGKSSTPIKCTHNHGSPNSLSRAIEQSCNPYFWCAFRDMLQKNGYGKDNEDFRARYNLWRDHVMQFGLGARFDESDISEQSSGSIPSTALFDRSYGKTGWKAITIRSLSIGQGEILATPLQLANQAAAIANEGYFITPHLLKEDSLKEKRHNIDVDDIYFDAVKEGMHRVMEYGTGRHYNIDSLQMCGKTGTAQNPHGKDHAIFIGFAPMESPKIAVAVIVENAGFGATWAAPMASLMMEQYLTDTITRPWLVDRMKDAVLNENVKKW